VFVPGVVEAIDVLKKGVGNLGAPGPTLSPDQFGYEGLKDGEED
jgi:hypothetical protein